MDLVFASKRDTWLVVVIWLAMGAAVAGVGVMSFAPAPLLARSVFGGLVLGSGGLSLWVLYGTGYTITATEVRVRSGPFRWRVPIAAIASIVPSNNPLSSPACSLDRLRVAFRGKRGRERALLLSPDDKVGFLAAIAARRAGTRAHRRPARTPLA